MNRTNNAALQVSLAYYEAWTSHDFERAMTYIADDVVCQAPAGELRGADAFRGFMGPFTEILTRASLIAAFADDEKALLMYDADTRPVRDAPGAECHTVRDGKIVHIRIIFDRLPFEIVRRGAPPA
ncbi:MAG: nuclear transport factor 2 family protein [Chloroflexi bacterium]|nr:nuclear transport factor 2 family protein [Chloroflexota bacterium]